MFFFGKAKLQIITKMEKNYYLCKPETNKLQTINSKPYMLIAVFCASSVPKNPDYIQSAIELGREIALRGHTLYYGGSNLGTMGHVSGAALAAGGEVVGVIPTFFSDEIIYSQPVTRLVKVASMAERKEYLIHHCDAFIALPGGIGTLDEVLEVMVANQLNIIKKKPIVLYNPNGFFDNFIHQIDIMGENGFFRSGKRPEIRFSADIKQIIDLCSE